MARSLAGCRALRIRRDPPAIVPIHELFEPEMHDALGEAIAALLAAYAATLSDDRRRLFERLRYVVRAALQKRRQLLGVDEAVERLAVGADDQRHAAEAGALPIAAPLAGGGGVVLVGLQAG